MLSKWSVKKPYTVLVGLILIIVLGVVSFTRMTTDLLPDINLPYAIVITAYPGASPTEVEGTVTKPVEQSMATVSNIKNVQSVSQENMSMVILEFAQTANMDSVSLEMREKLDQITSNWDDKIQNPIIMKLNPNMMPTMISAVEKDGISALELTEYVEKELSGDLESLEGVASVSTSGGIEETILVTLKDDLLSETNEKVQKAISDKFLDGEKELKKAQKELDDGKEKLDDGESQLNSGAEEAGTQLGNAQAQIADGQMSLLEGEADLKAKLSEAKAAQTELVSKRAELVTQRAQLQDNLDSLNQLPGQIAELKSQLSQIDAGLSAINGMLENPTQIQQIVGLKAAIAALEAKTDRTPEEEAMLQGLKEQYAFAAESLAQLGITDFSDAESLTNQLLAAQAQLAGTKTLLTSTLEELEKLNNDTETRAALENGIAQIDAGLAQIDDGAAQLESGIALMETALQQVASGKTTLTAAIAELNKQQITAIVGMAQGAAQISVGQMQVEAGQAQLDTGKETLKDQKKSALEAADLKNIITADMLSQILVAQNFSMPAGYISEDGKSYLVRVGDSLKNEKDLKDVVLMDLGLDGIDPIRLSDVAQVQIIDNSGEVYAKINGHNAMLLTIQKQTGYSTGDVADKINNFFASLQENDPDLRITNLMDQGIYIDFVVNSVLKNLLYGAVLAILVLLVFLRDIRPTAIVACSIPLSVMTAVVLMYFSGISLNIISLSGLALGVGMLVDNSIVVIENIYRLKGLGMSARKAAVQGARQMTGAILASTLTTVCVFLPIVFTDGITRQLFVDMGLTIAYSLLASLFIALTFVPMASAGLLGRSKNAFSISSSALGNLYEKIMPAILKGKILVLLGALALFLGSTYLAVSRGFTYMPSMESTQASVTVHMPEGSSFEDTAEMTDIVAARIATISDVEDVGAMIGGGSSISLFGGSQDETVASLYLILKEDKELTGAELENRILELTSELDCEIEANASSMDMSALGTSGISIQIKGKDLDTLQKIASDVGEILSSTEGLKDVDNGLTKAKEEVRIIVDKAKAAEYNLTVAQVYMQIQQKLADKGSATTISTDTYEYPVKLEDEKVTELTREEMENLKITATMKDNTTKKVKLKKIAEITDGFGLDTIRRDKQSRYINVSAQLEDDYNVTLVADAVQKELDAYSIPDGYTAEMAGEDTTIKDAMNDVMLMLALALLFMYLIMVAQFQSLLSPFIVMFTVPLAFTGGFLALLLTGMDVSIIAMIGFVMLCGIIVNNGIVLVDYINQLRISGMEKKAAIIEAGKTRMRPILMTALTTILGLLTMALGTGMGSDMVQPMAVVTIGGLLYGTLLTLFVVPCIYDLLRRKDLRVVTDDELMVDAEEQKLMDEII
ncbi:MAG: efflux RND transporter permease subunit [Lachnospiraceae bacterium]|nr:efflux RND transporter permease subunit [Lachnospiraceae bacterium]